MRQIYVFLILLGAFCACTGGGKYDEMRQRLQALNALNRADSVLTATERDEAQVRANVNLGRFGLKKMATKTTLAGAPDAENNFDQQPIAPQREQLKAQKKFSIDLQPYSFVMLEYQL